MASPLAETREALDALRRADYAALSAAHRLALLEALTHAVADTEQMRKCAPAAVVHKITLYVLICMWATLSKEGRLLLHSHGLMVWPACVPTLARGTGCACKAC